MQGSSTTSPTRPATFFGCTPAKVNGTSVTATDRNAGHIGRSQLLESLKIKRKTNINIPDKYKQDEVASTGVNLKVDLI